jgi:hypothetical protein
VGVLKDRLIGILITDDRLARKYLYQELVSEIRRRVVPVRPNRKASRKEYLRKPHFHHNHKSNCWERVAPNLLTVGSLSRVVEMVKIILVREIGIRDISAVLQIGITKVLKFLKKLSLFQNP